MKRLRLALDLLLHLPPQFALLLAMLELCRELLVDLVDVDSADSRCFSLIGAQSVPGLFFSPSRLATTAEQLLLFPFDSVWSGCFIHSRLCQYIVLAWGS